MARRRSARASFGELWNHVTTAFQRDWLMCVLAGVIFLAIATAGGLVSNLLNKLVSSRRWWAFTSTRSTRFATVLALYLALRQGSSLPPAVHG